MPIEIIIPRLGWSMEEGNFLGWLKKDGEQIKSGEPLFTLESEKAAQDIEATDNGTLRIPKESPQTGSVVKVGQVIGYLLAENETMEREIPSKKSPASKTEEVGRVTQCAPPGLVVESGGAHGVTRPTISPRARRRAAELGVDATGLSGSGRTGRIIEADVLKNTKPISSPGISVMRRTIAQRTSTSFSTTPHFYLRAEVDATALIQLRENFLPEIEKSAGVRVTLTDFILRAQAKALKEFPAANAIWVDDTVINLPNCDVGLVVGLLDGLIIPIVRSADAGDLATVAKQRSSLVESARSGNLSLDKLQGGATSLSNLGNTLVDEFAAVIAPPQSTMLAVGRAALRPYVMDGKIAARSTMKLCLSVDHRVLDGAPAAEFLGRIVELLEAPEKLV
ncbi:MAG: dihydrolipoamide acetyltransferase family protein [Verrucomicrobiota bacterium]